MVDTWVGEVTDAHRIGRHVGGEDERVVSEAAADLRERVSRGRAQAAAAQLCTGWGTLGAPAQLSKLLLLPAIVRTGIRCCG